MSAGKKLTLEEINKKLLPLGYEFADNEYKNLRTNHNFKCLQDNQIYKTSLAALLHRKTNGPMHNTGGLSIEEVYKRSLESGFEFIEEEYEGIFHKHKFRCLKNGIVYATSLHEIMRRKTGEPFTYRTKKYTLEEVKNLSLNMNFEFMDDFYNGSKFLHKFKCLIDNQIGFSRLSDILKGHGLACCGKRKESGKNHYNYNHERTDEERLRRRRYKGYEQWKRSVRKRDVVCQICNSNIRLHTHHLENYDENVDLRLDPNNGIVLCEIHHWLFHKIYTRYGTNTKQYNEFRKYQLLFCKEFGEYINIEGQYLKFQQTINGEKNERKTKNINFF